MLISKKDKNIIRDRAKRQLELASSTEMSELKKEWIRNNDCKSGRALVTVEWGTFQQEVIPPLLKCEGKLARVIETQILGNYVGQELFHDDSIVNDFVTLGNYSWFKPFNIKVKVDRFEGSVGHHFQEVIKDLKEDFHLLKPSTFGVVKSASFIGRKYLEHLVGDILPIKAIGNCLYAVPTQDIVHLMSMENMMLNMLDYPDEFKKMMEMLTDDYNKYFQHLEDKNFLLPTNGSERVAQGSYAFTSDLLGANELKGRKITRKDIWGFMDSQESSTISPDMYEELVFPYYKKVAENFGLFSYGCCEAVDPIWENCISKLKNLRKVSISPWCNEEYMGEQLKGKKIVYHRKPSPNYLGVDKVLDKEGLKAHIKRTVDATNGCNVEFTQRDVYTVHNDMQKVRDYVEIIRHLTTK